MACGVCEHCQGPVSRGDSISIREGYSYHKECHKCYVCSETDLKNAEIFKGVIFCSSCSQRIFQGCSTARQTKVTRPKRSNSRPRRRTRRSPKSHRERLTGVIELAGLVGSTGSESKSVSDGPNMAAKGKIALSTELALQVGKQMCNKNTDNMKKESVEMGTTTDVTQVLLTQIECTEIKKPTPTRHSYKNKKEKPKKVTCSDLRIAELGASTEIANMALRKKSEMPVIIKSESRLHREESISLSMLKQESDISGDVNEQWTGSAYSTLRDDSARPLMDRRIGSILKLPYKCFKRNILNRSSLISVLISNSSSEQDKMRIANRLKILFREEITDHQRRGMKRLYSTINRRKTPYRMGWLNLMMNISHTMEPNETEHNKRCKHFRRSHSYRCMRAKVMRLAGPTKSELAEFREKVKNAVAPTFVKNLLTYNKRYAIMMSKACGSDAHDGESIRKHLQKLVK